MKYNHIILGGTFDHFHVGHEAFIKKACQMGKRLTIGITTAPLYQDKPLAESIEDYATREANVKKYIYSLERRSSKISYIPIRDVYGSSLTDRSIDAIVVTPDTEKTAVHINQKRSKIGMKPLYIIRVPFILDSHGEVISSIRIRYGDIDRKGINYLDIIISKQILYLPNKLRDRMREPFGRLIHGSLEKQETAVNEIVTILKRENPSMVYAIGDIITGSLMQAGVVPSITIIDLKSRREALMGSSKLNVQSSKLQKYRNAPGTIDTHATKRLVEMRDEYLLHRKPLQLVIEGEEDLLALSAILSAPLNSIILYGQYNLGVVLVWVTENKKQEVYDIVSKFEVQ